MNKKHTLPCTSCHTLLISLKCTLPFSAVLEAYTYTSCHVMSLSSSSCFIKEAVTFDIQSCSHINLNIIPYFYESKCANLGYLDIIFIRKKLTC